MELICDRNEAMRYLGYRGQVISPEISGLIEQSAQEAESVAVPRYCSFEFDISKKDDGIFINETGVLLSGESIKRHLENCNRIILFAATIGIEIERRTRIYESRDMTRAVILDCCASALIETYCDQICYEIGKRTAEKKLFLTERFSPGYGDLPISLQKDFLRATNAQRLIGLTCNEHFLMFPRKSVTAIIGLSPTPSKPCTGVRCDTCSMNTACLFKKTE